MIANFNGQHAKNGLIISYMDTKQIQDYAESLWETYCEIFPQLVQFDCPKIRINNRFTKCAGRNMTDENVVELGGKFLAQFPYEMLKVILPHEIAHQIDFNLNGWYDRKPHHGKQWQTIMQKIGLPADPYHHMVLK